MDAWLVDLDPASGESRRHASRGQVRQPLQPALRQCVLRIAFPISTAATGLTLCLALSFVAPAVEAAASIPVVQNTVIPGATAAFSTDTGFLPRTPEALSYRNDEVQQFAIATRVLGNSLPVVVTLVGGYNVLLRPYLGSAYPGALGFVPRLALGGFLVYTANWWRRLAIDVNKAACKTKAGSLRVGRGRAWTSVADVAASAHRCSCSRGLAGTINAGTTTSLGTNNNHGVPALSCFSGGTLHRRSGSWCDVDRPL